MVTSISRRLNGEPDPDADMTREPRTRWSTRGPHGRTGVEHPALEHERRVRRTHRYPRFALRETNSRVAGGALERVFDARVERLRRTRVERRCCVWAGGLRLRASARACRGVCGAPFSPVGAKKNHRDEKDRANYFDTRFARQRRAALRTARSRLAAISNSHARTSVMRAPSSPRVPREATGGEAHPRSPSPPVPVDAAEAASSPPPPRMTRDEVDDALASSKRMAFAYARHHVPPRPPEETPASRAGPTPLVDPSAVPEVLRAVLLEDGCVKVNFRDNDVVCLDPTGTAFTVHTAAGETTRQLSEFVVSRFARKLRRALEFRNAHADVPFFPAVLSARASHAATFRCDARVSVARWSRCARDARRRKLLTNLEGGAVALESIDGIARVVLSAHGLVAHVTFPLLYAVRDADSDSDSGSRRGDDDDVGDATREIRRRLVHDYAWHTQSFAADACPERWAFPVALLTGVVYGDDEVEGDGKIEGDDGIEGDDENASAGSATILPASATASPRAPPSLWVDEGDEVEAEWWASASIAGYPDARGSSSAARRRGRRPATERVPGATQWTIRAKTSRGGVPWGGAPPGDGEDGDGEDGDGDGRGDDSRASEWTECVSALEDGGALVSASAGRFVLHVPDEPDGAAAAAMYRSDAVPDRVGGVGRAAMTFAASGTEDPEGGERRPAATRVPIGRFAARLVGMRAAAAEAEPSLAKASAAASSGSDADADPWSAESAEVVEESSGEGAARFTAYADGRVRASFADRTLLELRRDRTCARLLMPDGERVEVRCAAPMRWAPYVSAAVEFGLWAFLTPEERERAIETERARVARVEAEIDGISRFNAVVAGAPPPASPEPAGSRSPLRELRRQSPISITVPTSPLDGAKIRRVASLRGLLDEDDDDDAVGGVAAVAAAAATEAFDSSPPTMSVEEALAATTRWLEDARMELPAAEVPSTSPLESVSGHQGRADAVDRAFRANEEWLAANFKDATDLRVEDRARMEDEEVET